MATPTTTERKRAVLIGRLSTLGPDPDLTDEGIPVGLQDQLERMRARAAELGWDVFKEIPNPSLSAYKRRRIGTTESGLPIMRVWRPDLRETLEHLSSGRANAVLCLDLDRAFRDGDDLRDLHDMVEYGPPGIIVESCTGSLHMERGYDTFDAEIRVACANKASKDTARRVKAARQRQAKSGKFGGGQRPYGWKKDGLTPIPEEYEVLRKAGNDLRAGVKLTAIVAGLREAGVLTSNGNPFCRIAIRDMLLRPRNAGHMVYDGEILPGVVAPWEPVFSEDVWQAIRAILLDPKRTTTTGRPNLWLGSGIYTCPCGSHLTVRRAYRSAVDAYRCGNAGRGVRHMSYRPVVDVDRFVVETLLARLQLPEAVDLLQLPEAGVDLNALRERAKLLGTRKRQIAAEQARKTDGVLDLETLAVMLSTITGELNDIAVVLRNHTSVSPFAPLVGAEDPLATWEDMTLGVQRACLRALLSSVLIDSPRMSKRLTRAQIDDWRASFQHREIRVAFKA